MQKIFKVCFFVAIVLFLVSCGPKEYFNLSDKEWLNLIAKDLKHNKIDDATTHFYSMNAEHIDSPLTKHAMIMIANAHLVENEYFLASYFFDEYKKRFATPQEFEYFEYLKIKSQFLSFSNPNRDQSLMQESLEQSKEYEKNYEFSAFLPLVINFKNRFILANYYLDLEIYRLYKRMGNDISADIYAKKLDEYDFDKEDFLKPYLAWYRWLFE